MTHTLRSRQKYTHVRAVIATGLLAGALSWTAHAAAASSWSPTLLVNTEAFQIIDDASSSDLVLKFGATVNKTLTYDRTAQVFRFNDDVYVLGTLSGSTVRADTLLASSGALVTESDAYIDGNTLVVQANSNRVGIGTIAPDTALDVVGIMSGTTVYATKSFSGAGLGAGTDCDGAGSKLLWDATTGRFSCGTDQNTTAWSNTGALKTAFDERYVNVAGDTMTGALNITPTASQTTALKIVGSGAYTLAAFSGGSIVHTARGNPTGIGAYDTSGAAYDVAIVGKYAYVADNTSGLQILDISNPRSPTPIATLDTPSFALGIAVVGRYAYVADGSSGLQIIDISNPVSPVVVGTYNTSGTAYQVTVAGRYAYIADDTSGLQIVDISNPAAPTFVGTYNTSDSAQGITIYDRYAYVADGSSGLQIIDVTNPASPRLAGTYNTSGFARGVTVVGILAYVSDGLSGLQIVNVSNPASPTPVGTYNTSGFAYKAIIGGRYAYVADDTSVTVVDVLNPAAPSLIGTFDTNGSAYGIAVAGRYAYVADYTNGMQVLDINGFETPTATIGAIETNQLNVLSDSHFASNLAVDGMMNVGNGLQVFGQTALHAFSGAALTLSSSGTLKTPFLLNIRGLGSGSTLFANTSLRSSGSLVFEGAASGSSLYLGNKLEGAGLTDCDTSATSKLLWDATTGRFSCGADQSGGAWSNTGALKTAFDERYVNVAGDTMTGALTIKPANGNTGALLLSTRGGQHILFGSGGRAFDVGLKRTSTGTLMLSGSLVISAKGSGSALKEARLSVDHMQLGALEGGLYFGGVSLRESAWSIQQQGVSWAPKDSTRDWYAVAMSSDGRVQAAAVYAGQIYTSIDYGNTWTARDSNRNWLSVTMNADGKIMSAVAYGGQIYTSNNYGVTWTARDSNRNWLSIGMNSDGRFQTAGVEGGQIYTSSNYGVTWTARDSSRNWRGIAMSSDGRIQVGAVSTAGFIYVSTDYGLTWTAKDSSRSWYSVDVSADGKTMAAVENGGQIYTSTDYGATWTARDSARGWRNITISADGKTQTATVESGQIYTSTDYGTTWTARESSRNWRGVAMSSDGKIQTAVVMTGQVFVSHAAVALPGGTLNVSGTMSGTVVRAQTTLASSGSLVFEGAASGSSLYLGNKLEGAGLSDCDTALTSKLLWDATTGRFSCGTDQSGSGGNWSNTGALKTVFDERYVNVAGDTMTGALTIDIGTLNQRGTGTGLILFEKLRMLSGATLSGAIVIKAGPELGKTGSGELRLSVRELAGRELLRARGPNGMGYALQPSLFEKNIQILTPGGGTTVNGYGTTVTNDTTVSHPTPTQTFGYMANFATAATSGDDAGTSSAVTNIFRGSTTGSGGFFTYARLGTLETTSIRLFSGLADQTIATMVGADNPTGNHIGFQFSTARADTNWQFARKNGTTQTVTDTGLPFRGHNVYDLMMYCSDACTTVFWRIENVTLGTSAEGSVTDNLPTATTALRMVLGVEAQTTSARNIRMQKMYVEADR